MRNNQFSRKLINFSIFSSFSFRTVKSAEKIKLGLPRIKIAYLLINYTNEKKIVLIKKKGEKKETHYYFKTHYVPRFSQHLCVIYNSFRTSPTKSDLTAARIRFFVFNNDNNINSVSDVYCSSVYIENSTDSFQFHPVDAGPQLFRRYFTPFNTAH